MNVPRWIASALGPKGGQVAVIVLSMPVIYLFGFREMRFFLVPSASMAPSLQKGDQIVTLNEKKYDRGDVVVLEDPESRGEFIVKRIVAVGGDTVWVRDGALVINGRPISEPYLLEPPKYQMGPVRVSEGCFFVLGDNRNNSDDSHEWVERGLDAHPDAQRIVGKVLYIYYPYGRAGHVPSYSLNPASVVDVCDVRPCSSM